ncbi:MAG TPA: hypothetical protein VMF50_06590 [Candidatus Binataceae bacterium]|nr:hypothetical protein [Candidatus Binataceae bacterium]
MPRQIGLVRASLEYAALAPLWAPLRVLPLAQAVKLGGAIGPLAMALDRPNRPIAERNLSIAFPHLSADARRSILRETYRRIPKLVRSSRNIFTRAGRVILLCRLDRSPTHSASAPAVKQRLNEPPRPDPVKHLNNRD